MVGRTQDRQIPLRQRRSGALLTEALIAATSLGIAVLMAASVLVTVSGNRRHADRLLLVTEELHNQLERQVSRPYEDLTPDNLKQVALSAAVDRSLPKGRLQLDVVELQAPTAGKRIDARFIWGDDGNRPPVRLSAWVFAAEGTP